VKTRRLHSREFPLRDSPSPGGWPVQKDDGLSRLPLPLLLLLLLLLLPPPPPPLRTRFFTKQRSFALEIIFVRDGRNDFECRVAAAL
jgi:hypothetical protein